MTETIYFRHAHSEGGVLRAVSEKKHTSKDSEMTANKWYIYPQILEKFRKEKNHLNYYQKCQGRMKDVQLPLFYLKSANGRRKEEREKGNKHTSSMHKLVLFEMFP